ncbi:FusB/FusC family EF-G-binding protein [Paenibacillus sp. WLX1005]|uniref:FusB/FusC family EF-G-binding protein n=1 Tax=Paenibacillus sp. WLX1005 TaxID=3243766 RepID=UPI0039843A55
MQTPFIHNHQLNFIHKQADFLIKTMRGIADRQVLETVKYSAVQKIIATFDSLTTEQKSLLELLGTYQQTEDIQNYLDSLESHVIPFPEVTPKQIQKLFPKAKKLKAPEMSAVDLTRTTYLRWIDIAANRLFIVYPHEDRLIATEGQITPTNKRGFCMFCNRNQELGFFNVKMKAHSPDNLSSVGQYVCMDDETCNHSITDTEALEKFLLKVER